MARKNIFTKCYENMRWKFWYHRLMMHDNIVVIRVWSYNICIFIVRQNLTHSKPVYFAYVSIFSITFNIFLFFYFKLYGIWSWFLLRRKRLITRWRREYKFSYWYPLFFSNWYFRYMRISNSYINTLHYYLM